MAVRTLAWRVLLPKLAQKDELRFASRQVRSVEINGSFYSLQRPSSYSRWYEETPADFVFAIKGSRFLTHNKKLRGCSVPLANFFASGVLALEDKLGPILWQLPPQLPFDAERLEEFFALLPQTTAAAAALATQHDARIKHGSYLDVQSDRPLRYALEVRHESYDDPALVKLLRAHGVALVVADTAAKFPYLEDVTADFVYARLHGDEQLYVSGYGHAALDRWAAKIDDRVVFHEHGVEGAVDEGDDRGRGAGSFELADQLRVLLDGSFRARRAHAHVRIDRPRHLESARWPRAHAGRRAARPTHEKVHGVRLVQLTRRSVRAAQNRERRRRHHRCVRMRRTCDDHERAERARARDRCVRCGRRTACTDVCMVPASASRRIDRDHRIDVDAFHQELATYNRRRLTPAYGFAEWRDELAEEHAWRVQEGELFERARDELAERATEAPGDPDAFVAWFEALKESGPGQGDPLFPWLAETASREAMIWFLTQEVAGEAGFDDLVAMAQVKLPPQPKLEMARNYWDEMGQGKASGMHGPMLEALAHELGIAPHGPVVVESLALSNLMIAMGANRRLAFHAIGALGAIELTAPGRAAMVNAGLKRLGVGGEARRYFALHATLDVKHSIAWNGEVLRPLVACDPRAARAMAEGALVRLDAGRRCFERYRAELGV